MGRAGFKPRQIGSRAYTLISRLDFARKIPWLHAKDGHWEEKSKEMLEINPVGHPRAHPSLH
jgi:hypothetical protein